MANLEKLEAIATRMLKAGEKIEAKVGGSYSNDSGNGNYEIVKGFMAATNQRVLVVLNSVSLDIRKDSFTYGQIITATLTPEGDSVSLVMSNEIITLFDIIDDCDDPKKFHKYISDKKAPPPKATIASLDVDVSPPPKK